MAEAFVRTIKRDYVRVSPCANAATVMRQLPGWIAHYNEVHPHKALGYRSADRIGCVVFFIAVTLSSFEHAPAS
jgi:hypothetical protein